MRLRGVDTLLNEFRPRLMLEFGTPERRALRDAELRPYGEMPLLERAL